MVPPIPLGTLLRQRYLIQAILGQGGFGRTYLATDRERFDEKCVLKEFSVPYQDEVLIQKSRNLFQREASTLYQIQHPQVPRFWAAFEEGPHLFLVQDFVDGQTYRHLLHDRRQRGQNFSEIEVLHFLQKILPVMAYLHDRGIVHRDLSPDNIILKPDTALSPAAQLHLAETGLPVIIDFGAVKEATTHWPLTSAITRVGKVGYAPPEQLQTGQVYPNSDLYSLAASCLVLLTGKEPRALVDSQTLEWQWQPYADISDGFAAVLKRMLSVYPGDRYTSAQLVLQDLEPLFKSLTILATTETEPKRILPEALLPTVVNSSKPSTASSVNQTWTQKPKLLVEPWELKSVQRSHPHPKTSPLLRLGMITAFLLGTGIAGTWFWQRWWSSATQQGDVWVAGAKLSESEASKIIGLPRMGASNSIASPSGTSNGNEQTTSTRAASAQMIEFSPGKISTTLEGTLQGNMPQSYSLNAAKGQILTTTLNGSGVVMNILRSNQEGLDSAAYQTRSWTGQLPDDGQYLIQVAGSGRYTLDVAVTPSSRPTEERTDRISFARGTNGTTVTGSITPKQVRRYVLKANQGQLVLVKVLQGNITFSAIAPSGERIGGSSVESKEWKGQLPIEGDYVIEISATQSEDFVLSLEVF